MSIINEFNLKISEQKKAVRAFERKTGCKAFVGGYSLKLDDIFSEVILEMDDVETGKFLGEATMTIVMFDRRKSWVSSVYAC